VAAERNRRYVAWLLRHGRLLWLFALLAAIPATLRTAKLYASLSSGDLTSLKVAVVMLPAALLV
jgi:hypothetical protein